MIELQQVINMCLELSDDDDDLTANKSLIARDENGKPLRESDFIMEES